MVNVTLRELRFKSCRVCRCSSMKTHIKDYFVRWKNMEFKMRTLKKSSIAIIILLLCTSCTSLTSKASNTKECWICTWLSGQQLTERNNMPPAPGLTNNTLRQVVHVTLGGSKLRVQFSNMYGNSPVTIQAAHLAVSIGGSAIDTATDKALTFNGSPSINIPAGVEIYSLSPLSFFPPEN